MKGIRKVLMLWGVAWMLTACGQEAASTGNLAQDINMSADGQKSAEKSVDGDNQETVAALQENLKEDEGVFSFAYEGVTFIPGGTIDQKTLPKYTDVAEVPSCAFGGNDNVYQFKAFELTTHVEGEEEIVYSVYFVDPNLPTTEGLRLGDTVDDMISLYGEDYEVKENVYTYAREETSLVIIAQNDIVVSIEYRLEK